jgi:hypothetical protein
VAIAVIGKPRKPYTPGQVVIMVLVYAVLVLVAIKS